MGTRFAFGLHDALRRPCGEHQRSRRRFVPQSPAPTKRQLGRSRLAIPAKTSVTTFDGVESSGDSDPAISVPKPKEEYLALTDPYDAAMVRAMTAHGVQEEEARAVAAKAAESAKGNSDRGYSGGDGSRRKGRRRPQRMRMPSMTRRRSSGWNNKLKGGEPCN